MNLLAIDTALEACSVAMVRDGEALAVRSEAMVRGHQERLAPMVAEAMTEAGMGFDALHRIVVTIGPGSFTGLRVGLAFCKAMALALDIPCIGVGTLEALAAGAPVQKPGVTAVLDARRDHVYVQAFSDGHALTEAAILPIAAARAQVTALGATCGTVLVGPGAVILREEGGARGVTMALDAATIDPILLARLGAERTAPDQRPRPLYLRAPEARTLAERAATTTA